MSKKLPKELQKQQELKRQETINKVLRAIKDIESENRLVTITTLVEFTGLSRSVFSKAHIRDLLADYGYVQKSNKACNSQGKKKSNKLNDKDKIIAELRVKNAELERECELLRGRLVLAMRKIY